MRRRPETMEESLFTASMRVEDGENFEDIVRRADEALLIWKAARKARSRW